MGKKHWFKKQGNDFITTYKKVFDLYSSDISSNWVLFLHDTFHPGIP